MKSITVQWDARRGAMCIAALLLIPGAEAGKSRLTAPTPDGVAGRGQPSEAQERFERSPLYFEPNMGQAPDEVRFIGRGGAGTFFLTGSGLVMKSGAAQVRLNLAGSRAAARTELLEPRPGVSNYLLTSDPKRWRTHVPHYRKVRYREVYAGIDVVYYGDPRRLEYDFVVAPGADPRQIRLSWVGADTIETDATGDLRIRAGGAELRLHQPRVYQEIGGERREIEARYRFSKTDPAEVRIALARYNPRHAVTIDPVLAYSTYLGGTGDDRAVGMTTDFTGSVYIIGHTISTNFPLLRPFSTTFQGVDDVFVSKFSAGGALEFSTYMGGTERDVGYAVAVDDSLNLYLCGNTQSIDFPLLNNIKDRFEGSTETFVTRLGASGDFIYWSTYLGGNGDDYAVAMALDRIGGIYVAGSTNSTNYHVTTGAYQSQLRGEWDGFLTRLTVTNNVIPRIAMSTYVGGDGIDVVNSMAIDGAGNSYLTGQTDSVNFPTTAGAFRTTFGGVADAFVVKLNAAANLLLYSTYLGGSDNETGVSIDADEFGRAFVAGVTQSANFPTTAGAYSTTLKPVVDAFVTRLNSTGTTLEYSTFLGGTSFDSARAIKAHRFGYAFVAGTTSSQDFPTGLSPFQQFLNGLQDAFLTVLNPAGTALTYSTFLGGLNHDVASGVSIVASQGDDAVIVGETLATNYPTTPDGYDLSYNGGYDTFLSKLGGFTLSGCIASVSTPFTAFPAAGGSNVISVLGYDRCDWWAIAATNALVVGSPGSGTGQGTVTYNMSVNNAAGPRTTSVNVVNNIVPIIQRGTSPTPPFDDVPFTHSAVDHIALLKSNGITTGCSTTQYCPENPTTRGQMAVFIIRSMLGGDTFPYVTQPYFTDVGTGHVYFRYIQKMRELGITSGCTATTYCPDDPVTRGQMAVFVVRSRIGISFQYSPVPWFADVPLSHPYFAYIQKMKETGITTGCTANTYCSGDPTTRGQMAVFLIRSFFTPW